MWAVPCHTLSPLCFSPFIFALPFVCDAIWMAVDDGRHMRVVYTSSAYLETERNRIDIEKDVKCILGIHLSAVTRASAVTCTNTHHHPAHHPFYSTDHFFFHLTFQQTVQTAAPCYIGPHRYNGISLSLFWLNFITLICCTPVHF